MARFEFDELDGTAERSEQPTAKPVRLERKPMPCCVLTDDEVIFDGALSVGVDCRLEGTHRLFH